MNENELKLIEPRVIRGGKEFLRVYGISENKQAQMRSNGLPSYHNGKYFCYFVKDIDKYIKKKWRILKPKIKPLKQKI